MEASPRRGRDVLVEVLRSEGVAHVFGNPGTTELPLMDALVDAPDLAYVLALQEATAVGMADGYAQVTGRPAFLNLHTSAGLGNAIGNLTNARANGTPLVVTAGQQDRRHLHHDPLLSGDLVGLARPVAKWSHEVSTLQELGTILRRAFRDAATPPTGPVFVSLPMDLLDEMGHVDVPPRSAVDPRTVPAALDDLAARLAAAPTGSLAIVAGDEVADSGGLDALAAVAEVLGCPVYGSPLYSAVVFPTTHQLWAGPLPPFASAINRRLAQYDTVLLVGGQAFMVYPWTPGPAVPEDVALLHLSPDPAQLGRVWPTALGLVGDPRATLEALLPLLPRSGASPPTSGWADQVARAEAGAREAGGEVPMAPAAAVLGLLEALPAGLPVVDEAITTGGHVRTLLRADRPGRYFFCRGGGLGWGMPAALGVSLGTERAPVLCIVGDGSAMYSPQALWTAANQGLPVVYAVVDNRQYLILKQALRAREDSSASSGTFVGMDLDRPPVDFVALARSMGVEATLVEKAADVGPALRSAVEGGRPHLLHLPIAG